MSQQSTDGFKVMATKKTPDGHFYALIFPQEKPDQAIETLSDWAEDPRLMFDYANAAEVGHAIRQITNT